MTKLAEAYDALAEAAAAVALELRANDRVVAHAVASMNVTNAPQDAPGAPLAPLEPFEDTPQGRSAGGGCPRHGLPWEIKPAGTSKKTGEPYRAFWHCNEENDDGSFCREKPTPAWQKAHPAG